MGAAKKAGYLDDVFNVLDANKHPFIIMGRFALKWMGCGVFSEEVTVLCIDFTTHLFNFSLCSLLICSSAIKRSLGLSQS